MSNTKSPKASNEDNTNQSSDHRFIGTQNKTVIDISDDDVRRLTKNGNFINNPVVASVPSDHDLEEGLHDLDEESEDDKPFRIKRTRKNTQTSNSKKNLLNFFDDSTDDNKDEANDDSAGQRTDVRTGVTFWGSYVEQFCEFLTSSFDHGKIIAIIQPAMMKLWDKKMCVQNGYRGTKLFLLNGAEIISTPEFKDIEDFRKRLLENQQTDTSKNAASRISTASKNSTKYEFVGKYPMRNIAEPPIARGVTSAIVGTICAIKEEEGWWYIGCRGCQKKLVKSTTIVDLESETPKKQVGSPTEWYYRKCHINVSSIRT
ncbi:nucleic acid-binding, OB-fold protein [Artemisia annua]|uniref:Nucleic acid-binding, OB-fold protein n=1 Tax=Artemisia annua TaxID=35608 RepID=A0A2U1NU31_ARTAN|nr:nucleic acid-binding, OB-fold protein [Artemisia annua]